jgi:hypothetical protein
MRYKRLLILLMSLVASGCLYLWLNTSGESSNFGLNAFTETLGILITVLIVDDLITRQEELRSLPQKVTAYDDVRLLTDGIIGFWSDVCRACVPEPPPASLEELFCRVTFDKMLRNLNLDAVAPVTPTRTWWDWFPQNVSGHKKRAETILERHNIVLDPRAYAHVHHLATGVIEADFQALRQSDFERGVPRPHILGHYYFVLDDYFQMILSLASWCERQVAQLERNGVVGLRRVRPKVYPWDRWEAPSSMIAEDELRRQLVVLQQHDERRKAELAHLINQPGTPQ